MLVAGLGVFAARTSAQRYARDLARLDAQYAADQAAAEIDDSLTALRDQMAATAVAPAAAQAIRNGQGCTLTFTGLGPITSGHIDFLAPDGTVTCTSHARQDHTQYVGASWLQGAADGYVLAGPLVDAASGESVLVSLTPVPDDAGFVAVFLDLDTLAPGLGAQFAGRRALEIVVTTADSDRVVSRSLEPERWSDRSITGTPFAGVEADSSHADLDGERRIYGHRAVTSQAWTVYAGASEATALADSQHSFSHALIIVLAALGVMLLILVVVYRRIAGPIRALSRSVRVQAADPTHRIEVRGPAEVADVAEEFNQLVHNLQRELVDRRAAEASAREAAHTYRVMFDGNPQPMWIWARDTMRFLAVNEAALSHYGYSREEFLAMTLYDVLPSDAADGSPARDTKEIAVLDGLGDTSLHSSGPWRHVIGNGDVISVEITSHSLSFYGRPARVAMLTDVTERLAQEKQLRRLALHDELTDLPNRTLAVERIGATIAHAPPGRITLGVLFVDLDRFKLVNDVHGHACGDSLLKEFASRLTDAFRDGETVARLASDEFVVVCPDLSGETEAISMASRIEGLLATPFAINDSEVFLTASVGISLHTGTGDSTAMVGNAEAAMYRAKHKGGNRYEIFDDAIRARTLVKLATSNELRRAIDRDELRLHYQPEIDLRNGTCFGAEALIRWQHPTRGLLAPIDFIPLAEENGFIIQLGAWTLNSACHQAAEWVRAGIGPRSVSVNLSARELAEPSLVGRVGSALDQSGLDPGALCLEITETSLLEDPDSAIGVLASLRDLGVRLSIDDFGTGYSSLLYLRRYAVDYLKIDQSFVNGLGRDRHDTAIVASVIDLAHAFGIAVIAEGVETNDQARRLTAMGCDVGQGYLWSRPVPPADLPEQTRRIEAQLAAYAATHL